MGSSESGADLGNANAEDSFGVIFRDFQGKRGSRAHGPHAGPRNHPEPCPTAATPDTSTAVIAAVAEVAVVASALSCSA